MRKKWRIPQVMAVPANWQGSPEHFYHFHLGYFMPLVLWQHRKGIADFSVRDCGPMNNWFDLLAPGTQIAIIPPGVMLERYLSHRQERVVFHSWDDPTRFHRSSLSRYRSIILNRTPVTQQTETSRPVITVLDRRSPSSFYSSDRTETSGGGSEWRSIPNISSIAEALSALGSVDLVDTATLTPTEQVALVARTDLLVAQHGAGLSNMVWMGRGGSVIEILPPQPDTIDAIFRNLAAARDLGYRAVAQEDEHASVDTQPILQAAQDLLESPTVRVPTPTGSWPVRMVRRLPRRL